MFELTDLEAQATAIDAAFRRDLDALAKRQDLSTLGKAQQAQALDDQRRSAVARLQSEARQRHATALQKAQEAAQAAKASEIERQRQLLGDVVMLDIYRRRIGMKDGDELLQMAQNAADGWERELVRQLATVELEARTATNPTRQDVSALMELRTPAQTDVDLRQLQQATGRIDSLDLAQYRTSMADRLGVDSRYVEAPTYA